MDDIDEEDIALEESESEGVEGSLYEHYRIVADRNQSLLRIDKFLSDRLTNTSRNRIKLASEADCILVNGISVKT
ncbi:MAG: RNA pseudouridine synthase, partial [Tannerella sp.]|nr:RNA pseudouridine synthase [Tannerella sp.]